MPLILCALIIVMLFPALPVLAEAQKSSSLTPSVIPDVSNRESRVVLLTDEDKDAGSPIGSGMTEKTVGMTEKTTTREKEEDGERGQERSGDLVLFTPEALPQPCGDCGLRYFPPSSEGGEIGKDKDTGFPITNVGNDREGVEGRGSEEAPTLLPEGEGGQGDGRGKGETRRMSVNQLVEVARRLVKEGQFPQALQILRPLTEARPAETEVQFLLGTAASRLSQASGLNEDQRFALLDEAIAAYRSILIRRPELVRVRLDLALAFFFKQQDGLAREHFERVLVGELPEPVVANVNRFLNVMRARRRWNGYFGFSVAPDTNINAASDASIIYINGLPFRRGQTGRASSDIGVVGWGGGEYQYPLTNRWRLRTGVNVNHREYKGSQFDQTFISGYAGPRWLITRNTEMSLLATASQRWWGGNSFNYDFGTRLEVEHRLLPGLWLSGRASWQDRKYQQQRGLEGSLTVVSLGASYVLLPTVRVNSQIGYSQQGALAHRWNSTGYWTRVGTNVALPWGFTVGASAEFRWDEYEDGWFPFTLDNSTPREDQTRILQATLLNRAVTVFGFSPQVAFSNQVRESNAQLWDYTRNLVEMRWVRQF